MSRSLPIARELPARGALRGPVAVLSLHSHRERSFLDDVALHQASGALGAAGIVNDLVVACITGADGELPRLVELLRRYPTIVYERVWSAAIIRALAEALPDARWIKLRGEHHLDGVEPFVECEPGQLVSTLAHLLDHPLPEPLPRVRPNLQPIYAADEDRPKTPSFPIRGSTGCPYGADARGNPLYAGLSIPPQYGRGCAFCTTGNTFEHQKPTEALASTLDQLRYVRTTAPSIEMLVLRDENPFAYLTELVEAAEQERLGPFTLLVESRADWWLQNSRRFERALESARRSSIRIAPFLVGIESFSQPELDRFNKGISADVNVRFLAQLRAWAEAFAPALDLGHGAFGFILFTPWTTLADLRENFRWIEHTRLHELRGRLLLSRARLYPDTALYYLAERDGLLADAYASASEDSSARYGYLPARPFRFADPLVTRFSELAAEVLARRGHRDEMAVFRVMLELAEADPQRLTLEEIEDRLAAPHRERLERALAETLLRAPRLPVALPLFDLELQAIRVAGDEVLVSLARGQTKAVLRVRGPGQALVEPETDSALEPQAARLAARIGRSVTVEKWAAARALMRSFAR